MFLLLRRNANSLISRTEEPLLTSWLGLDQDRSRLIPVNLPRRFYLRVHVKPGSVEWNIPQLAARSWPAGSVNSRLVTRHQAAPFFHRTNLQTTTDIIRRNLKSDAAKTTVFWDVALPEY
jgi:hypothetical protein